MQSFSSSAFFPRAWGKNALFGRFSGIKWRSGVRQAASGQQIPLDFISASG